MIYCAAMSGCDGAVHPHAKIGLELFNQGRYFEAHEELETAWKDERAKVRRLYQGILEAGVTYLHIRRGNYPGALKVYSRSMKWLTDWPEICRGIDVGQLRTDLEAAINEVRRLGPESLGDIDPSFFKPIIWKDA